MADGTQGSGAPAGRRAWWAAAAVFVVCLAVWHGTAAVPFHFDDGHTVLRSSEIRNLRSIGAFLGGPGGLMRRGALKAGLALNYAAGTKHPDGRPRPGSFHVVNMVLHAANAVLVFLLVYMLIVRVRVPAVDPVRAAALVAVLFAVSPIHSMAVNLIANRAVLQMAAFSLLALVLGLLALDARRSVRARCALAVSAAVMIVLSASSKSVGVATIGLFALLAWRVGALTRLTPRIGLALAAGAVLLIVLILGLSATGEVWQESYHGVGANLLTQAGVLLRYLGLMVWPSGLCVDHDVAVVSSAWQGLAALNAAAVFVLLGAGVFLSARGSWIGVGILWFFVALAPSSGVVPRVEIMMEYRTYLGVLGFWMAAAAVVHAVAARFGRGAWSAGRLTVVFLALAAAANSAVTIHHNRIYRDPVALWEDAVRKSPDKPRARINRGVARAQAGDFDGALRDHNRVIELDPENGRAYAARGAVHHDRGDLDAAIRDYGRAIELRPGKARLHFRRGQCLYRTGDTDAAIRDYDRAIEIDPYYADVYVDRGTARQRRGDMDGAMRDYDRAVEINANDVWAYVMRANCLYRKGDADGGIRDCDRAVKLDPDNARAWFIRGLCRHVKGDLDAAIGDYDRAIGLDPRNATALVNRGILREARGDLDGAIGDCARAIELDPLNVDAWFSRAS
ncbi:MAG: tetratricopeptide repeat protein, partial [Planctomycetota bacterium]